MLRYYNITRFDIPSRRDGNGRWDKKQVFELRASHLHTAEVEHKQHESRKNHAKIAKGDQYALHQLRAKSGVPSQKRTYVMEEPEVTSPAKKARKAATEEASTNRLEAVRNRLKARKPTRFNIDGWKYFRYESIQALQPYYSNTDLAAVVAWIESHAKPPRSKPLSSQEITDSLKGMNPHTEIASSEEMAALMKALGFIWGHLHSSYYTRISRRFDVICHRSECIPILHEFMTNPRYLYVNTDWSFEYENDISKYAWIPLTEEESDLVDSKPGKGKRFSFCEFLSLDGVLRHPDGKSAGTILTSNQTLSAEDVLRTIRRGLEAVTDHPDVKAGRRIPVLHLDGARNQTTKDSDYINPNDINLSDGGTNRVSMAGIGTKGLKSVLTEENQWSDGMRLAEARDRLWASKLVRDQLSQIEKLGKEFGVIILYNPKAHPWLAFIEKLWRWVKNKLQNLLKMAEISQRYGELMVDFMDGTDWAVAKCKKWFNLSLKYVEYYSRGGEKIIRERDMIAMDLSKLKRPAPKPKFANPEAARQAAHEANFILFRGKQYKPVDVYW